MANLFKHFLTTGLAFTMLMGGAAAGQAASTALPVYEQLEYQVSWNGLPAGTLQQTLKRQSNGSYLLTVTANTNRAVNIFYRLDSDQTSLFRLTGDRLQVLRYTHQNKGSEPFPREVRFDWEQMQAHMKNEKDGRKDVPITRDTYDPNTLIQQIRFFPASVKDPFMVVDGKSNKRLQIKDLGVNRIHTSAGEFAVRCVEQVDVQQDNPDKKRVASICYSQDERHLPVELRFHSKYGDFVARLKSIQTQTST